MFIAKRLKDESVCEYLLYMWQVEDILRAYELDEERLAQEYASRFPEEEREKEARWLADLCCMMREEGCRENGHLQMNKGTLILLTDLHHELLNSPKHPFYVSAYQKALPSIVDLRRRGDAQKGELETCFDALYGVMMLRLQKKEISTQTEAALLPVKQMLHMLSDAYKKDKEGTLEL